MSATAQAIIDQAQARLEEIEGEWSALDTERRKLHETLVVWGVQSGAREHKPNSQPASTAPTRTFDMTDIAGLGTTQAVRRFVARYPGLNSTEIMDALTPVVVSEASGAKLRKLISWTLTNLTNHRNLLRKDEEGRFHPVQGTLID